MIELCNLLKDFPFVVKGSFFQCLCTNVVKTSLELKLRASDSMSHYTSSAINAFWQISDSLVLIPPIYESLKLNDLFNRLLHHRETGGVEFLMHPTLELDFYTEKLPCRVNHFGFDAIS